MRFADGLSQLLDTPQRILLEVGPGQTLRSLAGQHVKRRPEHILLGSLRPPNAALSDVAFLLETLGRIWVSGGTVDWEGFYRSEKRRRVPLPTYPFERHSFWLEAPRETPPAAPNTPQHSDAAEVQTQAARDFFYRPVFVPAPPAEPASGEASTWLILVEDCADGASVGDAAAQLLAARGERVVTVRAGDAFACAAPPSDASYTVRPRQRADFDRLFAELAARGLSPRKILHLWNLSTRGSDDVEAQLDRSFYSLLSLAQTLGATSSPLATSLCIATRGLFRVDGEPLCRPLQATALGPCLVLPKEYEQLRCRCIDLPIQPAAKDAAQPLDEQTLALLVAECGATHDEPILALRNAQRYVQTYEKAALPPPAAATLWLRPAGVYLIFGGLGGIGLSLATYLAQTVKARLILTGRSAPDRDVEQRVKAIEAASSDAVLCLTCDLTDRAAVQAAVHAAQQRFGHIDGVIHCAGIAGGEATHTRTPDAADAVLRAKVHGTLILDDVLKNEGVDFVALCSSLNAIVGVFGQIDYTAANAFLDAFAQHRHGATATHYLSINWDAWRDIGMAAAPVPVAAPATSPVAHPLLQTRLPGTSSELAFHATLDAKSLWLLNEHRLLDQPTLPGTAYLDAAAAAIYESGLQKGTAIEHRASRSMRRKIVEWRSSWPVATRCISREMSCTRYVLKTPMRRAFDTRHDDADHAGDEPPRQEH